MKTFLHATTTITCRGGGIGGTISGPVGGVICIVAILCWTYYKCKSNENKQETN